MYVIGTAGHVDHGKSTLIQALTGIDPDRLREEKERGMTIDLGFAWLQLPGGQEVSVVDVPGHERFIKNMLAGVGGVDLALLVVAADESVMPQTTEHLAILDLLQIQRGVVAVTKKDLVDEDWLELVVAEVEEILRGTTLEGSPIVTVSATTGDGLPKLVSAIEESLRITPAKKDVGRPRLPIDRSFVMSGFGTVVTGTLVDGRLRVGQEVQLTLLGEGSRIRGLQTHKRKIEEALPGSRVAVNLVGIPHEEIERGEVLTIPGWLRSTTALDVRLHLIHSAPRPLKHSSYVTFHTGSSETTARVRLLERGTLEPGESTWAQFRLHDPLAMVKGDFFVIRSSEATLGGGNVVDAHPRRHRRMHLPTLERLAVMEKGSSREVLLKAMELSESCEFRDLIVRANLGEGEARKELKDLTSEKLAVVLGNGRIGPGSVVLSASRWAPVAEKVRSSLEAYHHQFPLRRGMPKEQLRSRLNLPAQTFGHALRRCQEDGILVEEGALVRLPQHRTRLTQEQRRSVEEYLRLLESAPYSPPTDSPLDEDLLNLLSDEGKVVRVSEAVVFSTGAYKDMVDRIVAYTKEYGKITLAEVRDMFQTSRKYALALMEHLDQRRITRRVGDQRVLR